MHRLNGRIAPLATTALVSSALTLALFGPPCTAAKVKTISWLGRSAGSELQWYKAVAASFEKDNPGIRVKLIYADSESYDTKLMNMIIAGQAPDVWTNLGNSGFMDFMVRKFVLDLTPYVNQDKYDLKDYMPMSVRPFVIKGKTYGVSHSTYSSFTYYNLDMFAAAGLPPLPSDWVGDDWTWAKMVEYAKRLTIDANGDGKPERWGITANFHLADVGLPWLFGGEWWPEAVSRETGFPTKSTIFSQAVVDAYQAKLDLMKRYKVYGGDFASRTCAILCDATWVLDTIAKSKKLNWSVGPLPKGTVSNAPTLYVDPWTVFSQSKNPAAAWTLVKYICSKESQEQWVELTGRMPSRKSVLPRFLSRHPVAEARLNSVVQGSFEVGRQSLFNFTVNSNQYIRVVDPLVQKIWQGKMGVEQALKQADDALARTIKTSAHNLSAF